MVEVIERKYVEKVTMTIDSKVKGDVTYQKRLVWDKNKPVAMVIANYPTETALEGDNLTSILIRNAIVERGTFGGVVIANLFNIGLKWTSNNALIKTSVPDGLEELVSITKEVDKVIIATGSLTTKYEVATTRLSDYIEQCKQANVGNKLFWLVNSGGKKVHPLALRNEPWQFSAMNAAEKTDEDEQNLCKST